MSEVEELRAEIDRLRAIINSQKKLGVGPFSHRRSIGRHANALYASNQALRAKLKKVEALADEWLTDHGDWLGRPRSWWDEKPYGEELRARLA